MREILLSKLLGKNIVDSSCSFVVTGKNCSNITAIETEWNDEKDCFVENGNKLLLTKSELENALRFEMFAGKNVNVIMGSGNIISLYVAARETGDTIEEVFSIKEGIELIEKFEESDKKEGTFEVNFYDVVDRDNNSVL